MFDPKQWLDSTIKSQKSTTSVKPPTAPAKITTESPTQSATGLSDMNYLNQFSSALNNPAFQLGHLLGSISKLV